MAAKTTEERIALIEAKIEKKRAELSALEAAENWVLSFENSKKGTAQRCSPFCNSMIDV